MACATIQTVNPAATYGRTGEQRSSIRRGVRCPARHGGTGRSAPLLWVSTSSHFELPAHRRVALASGDGSSITSSPSRGPHPGEAGEDAEDRDHYFEDPRFRRMWTGTFDRSSA